MEYHFKSTPWHATGRPWMPSEIWRETETYCDECGKPALTRRIDEETLEYTELCEYHFDETIQKSSKVVPLSLRGLEVLIHSRMRPKWN